MNEDAERFENDLRWCRDVIHTPMNLMLYVSVFLYIGQRSIGFPDFGISIWHVALVWAVTVSLLWATTFIVGKRLNKRIERAMHNAGYTIADIEELCPKQKWWKI